MSWLRGRVPRRQVRMIFASRCFQVSKSLTFPDRKCVLKDFSDQRRFFCVARYYCSEKLAEDRKASGRYDPRGDYSFQHWNRIDIFVYFSHNFITVPPCTWIHQAHTNGVKVLGLYRATLRIDIPHGSMRVDRCSQAKFVRTHEDGHFFPESRHYHHRMATPTPQRLPRNSETWRCSQKSGRSVRDWKIRWLALQHGSLRKFLCAEEIKILRKSDLKSFGLLWMMINVGNSIDILVFQCRSAKRTSSLSWSWSRNWRAALRKKSREVSSCGTTR